MSINLSLKLREVCPDMKLLVLAYDLRNGQSNHELITLFEAEKRMVFQRFEKTAISSLETIDAARKIYRKLGKDPTRYRVSSESLLRRVHLNKGLESVSAVVDCLNIASMRFGLSIGAYDMTTLSNAIVFDIGTAEDSYEAVGRGLLNVSGLPVLRDAAGVFGSTTTDSERSKVLDSTTRVLFNIIAFNGVKAEETAECLKDLLEKFTEGKLLWTLEA